VTENKCLHTVASCWTFINIVMWNFLREMKVKVLSKTR